MPSCIYFVVCVMYSAPVGGYEVVRSKHTHPHTPHSLTDSTEFDGRTSVLGRAIEVHRESSGIVCGERSEFGHFEREISDSRDSYDTLVGPVLDGALYLHRVVVRVTTCGGI